MRTVICDRCGRDNPEHLIFCQDCGRRLQEQRPRVVPPTPPAGLPAAVPNAPERPAQPAPEPLAPPTSEVHSLVPNEPGALVCSRCQTRNPPQGKFCVSCGAQLSAEPAPEPPRPSPEPPAAQAPAPIAASGVVLVAPPALVSPPPLTCERCGGVSEPGMRFCKYCGAPLPAPLSPPPGPVVPSPAPVRPAPAYGPSASVQPPYGVPATAPVAAPTPQKSALEEAARQAAAVQAQLASTNTDTATAPNPQEQPPTEPANALELARLMHASAPTSVVTSSEGSSPSPGVATGQFAPIAAVSALATGRLILVGGDGQEGPSFPLTGDQVDIGRLEGTVVLSDDRYMSPRHARLIRIGGRWHLRDLESTNGVYLRLSRPHDLLDGDLLLLGVEVLRFELVMDAELGLGPAIQHGTLLFGSPALPRPARLVQRTVEGVARDVYHLHRLETVIGRESGDLVFTDDPYLSRRHAVIRRSTASGSFSIVDLNSSNGTFIAIRGDCLLQDGDSIRVGQHLFRVELAPG